MPLRSLVTHFGFFENSEVTKKQSNLSGVWYNVILLLLVEDLMMYPCCTIFLSSSHWHLSVACGKDYQDIIADTCTGLH